MDYTPADLLRLDLSAANPETGAFDPRDTPAMHRYVFGLLARAGKRFGWGGYGEDRSWYSRGAVFQEGGEVRTVHLGIDIWTEAGSPVFAAAPGLVHSFRDNAGFGDYGPTLILAHGGFFSLYGHLSRESMAAWREGASFRAGERIGELGTAAENGHWPPHLHFQLIRDLGDARGDYPGVALARDRETMLANCPDPAGLLEL